MMKVALSLIAISLWSLFGSSRVAEASAYDIICEYKYKIGEGSWVFDASQGTTRAIAKSRRRSFLKRQEEKARESGQNFEAIYMFCYDPWGNSSDGD